MKRILIFAVLACVLLSSLKADEIVLGRFPRGKWLDTQWKAYWVFGEDTIHLLDVRDREIYDFSGIVQNMIVEKIPGGMRLSFDCAKARRSYRFEKSDSGGNLRMRIRQAGTSLEYSIDMPAISDQELAVYKSAVIRAETAPAPPSLTAEQRVAAAVENLLLAASLADFSRLEILCDETMAALMGDQVRMSLEASAAKSDAPPAVFISLSVLYGRLGLKTREYSALVAAESAIKPGLVFNIAALYGRKQLLAGSPGADSFMIGSLDIRTDPPGATILVDGNAAGQSPALVEKIRSGRHMVSLLLDGYESGSAETELGVGETVELAVALKQVPPKPVMRKTAVSDLSVQSPAERLYESAPVFSFLCGNSVSLSLNGVPVAMDNGAVLSGSRTGCNQAVITEKNEAGRVLSTVIVDFFLNDLALRESDSFTTTEEGARYSGKAWSVLSPLPYNTCYIYSTANTVASKGATDVNGLGAIWKPYDAGVETKAMQKMDVIALANPNSYALIGFVNNKSTGNSAEFLGLQLANTGNSYMVNIIEAGFDLVPFPFFSIKASTGIFPKKEMPLSVYFLRDGNDYQGAVFDLSGKLLAMIKILGLKSALLSSVPTRLDKRGIILAPADLSNNSAYLVQVGNYAYYR